jgi:uncharacterized membrane protein HdeD (DUF308 family)
MSTQVDPFALVPPQVIQHWGISLAMGVALNILAIVAWLRSSRSSIDSVYFFGWLFIIASAIEAFDAYLTGGWSGFYLHLFGAVLFGVTGFMLLTYAKTSAEIASLIVAMYFITAGIFNVIAPMAANVPDRGWHVLAGFITLILGPVLLGYRTRERVQMSVFRVIGIFIGIDLFFRGLAFSFLASDLRSHLYEH